jgi:hypothetical protein
MNSQESSEKSGDFRRFDDLVRSERFFTATLLPAVLFHKDLQGVQRFLELIDQKATTECDRSGTRGSKGATKYGDLKDVEIITEFHIARDLNFAGLPLAANVAWTAEPAEPDEEGEPEQLAAPDVVIMAGEELVVCEGKFFSTFNAQVLNDQLRSQRSQVRHLFLNRPKIRAYRHVAIVPKWLDLDEADAVLTWKDIRKLAEELMGSDHYVTIRLREAVKRYEPPSPPEPYYDGILLFKDMREKCRASRNDIQVGHAGGETNLLSRNLVYAETKEWKWRDPKTNRGVIIPRNWLGCCGSGFLDSGIS